MFKDFRKYLDYRTEDFIKDQEFLDWINHQNIETRIFWNNLLEKYPELKNKIEEAKLIIKSLQPEEHIVSDETLNKIFNKIVESKETTGKRNVLNILKIAAFVVVS